MASEYGDDNDQGLASLIANASAQASDTGGQPLVSGDNTQGLASIAGGAQGPQQVQMQVGEDQYGNPIWGYGPAPTGLQDSYAPGQEQDYLQHLEKTIYGNGDTGPVGDAGNGESWRYTPEKTESFTPEQAVDLYNTMDPRLANDPAMAAQLAKASRYFSKEGDFTPGGQGATAKNLTDFMAQDAIDAASRQAVTQAVGLTLVGGIAGGAMLAGAGAGAGAGSTALGAGEAAGTVAGNGTAMGATTAAEAASSQGILAGQLAPYAAEAGAAETGGLASLAGETGGTAANTAQQAFRAGELADAAGAGETAATGGATANTAQQAFRAGELASGNSAGTAAASGGLPSWATAKNLKLATSLLGSLSSLAGKGKQTLGGEGGKGWYYHGNQPAAESGGGGGDSGNGTVAARDGRPAVTKIPQTWWQNPVQSHAPTDYLRTGAQGKRYYAEGGDVDGGSFHDMFAQAVDGLGGATGFAEGGQVPQLQENGFVIPADVLSHLGNGNTAAGSDVLNQWLRAHGSHHGAQHLAGPTDGMADAHPTSIDGVQPASLSDGEAVITPEDVARVGGAAALRKLMAEVRKARTGTSKQAPQIDPRQFLASGGPVMRFDEGGGIPAIGPSQSWGGSGSSNSSTSTSGMADWARPYVDSMLGTAWGLSETPYQAYTGPLTAGASDLQNKGFAAAGAMEVPQGFADASASASQIGQKAAGMAYDPREQTFGTVQAQQYMNPYLQNALDPQIAEARRQSQISGLQDNARLTQAGAYGGSRQAIMDSERQRNLGTNLANITGQGYNTAYTNAQSQFNADRTSNNQDRQFGAQYGLSALNTQMDAAKTQGAMAQGQQSAGIANLNAMMGAGAVQRGITAEGIAADKAQFDEEKNDPFKKNAYMQSVLQGLPLNTSTSTSTGNSGSSQGSIGAWGSIADMGQPAKTGWETAIGAGTTAANLWEAYNQS
jgi:hypothetical protein